MDSGSCSQMTPSCKSPIADCPAPVWRQCTINRMGPYDASGTPITSQWTLLEKTI